MLCLPGTDFPWKREELLLALALLLVHKEADDVGLGNLVCVSNQNARNAPVIDQLIGRLRLTPNISMSCAVVTMSG